MLDSLRMQRNKNFSILITAAMLMMVTLALANAASAKGFKELYSFPELGDDQGNHPAGSLIFDAAGNLYGTATGSNSLLGYNGLVYKLTPNPDGSWAESTLYTFTGGADGANPFSNLVFDAVGNLYGTTSAGGVGSGVVFKLSPNSDGSWTQSVIYTFTGGSDGAAPLDGLVFDAAGKMYGTTSAGGAGSGVVFKLTPNSDGSWTQSVIYTFTGGADGANPHARLIFDPKHSLYGTTSAGGIGAGVVFKLSPNPDGSWTQSVLYTFTTAAGGRTPVSSLVFDRAGNLYGTTMVGGRFYGVVFQLKKNSDGSWTENVLHTFTDGTDGGLPQASLILDQAGNLYGISWIDTIFGWGAIFKLSQKPGGGWTTTVLLSLSSCGRSQAGMIFDAAGNLYGTCSAGSAGGQGAVFEFVRK